MEGKGFRGLPICNCNRRTGNMTGGGEKSSDAPLLSFPFSFPFLLPCYFPSRPFRLRRFQVGTVLPKCRKSSVRVRQRPERQRRCARGGREKESRKTDPAFAKRQERRVGQEPRQHPSVCVLRRFVVSFLPSFLPSVCRPPYTFQQAPFPGHAQSGRTSLFSGCMIELHWPVAPLFPLSPQFYLLYSSSIDHYMLHAHS